jgi:mono/diheme cytochrome c family protein
MRALLFAAVATLLVGCNNPPPPSINNAAAAPARQYEAAQLGRGKALFQANCAVCHGAGAQGAFTWRVAGPDGKYLPPPLNGTGHAWHHPKAALKQTIRRGTLALGGNMPPWQDKLSEQDIEDLIAWFQSLWPDEVYQAWWEIDQRAMQARR